MSEIFVVNGIVDKVRAIRRNDEVKYLEATVHVTMGDDYIGEYGGKVTTNFAVPLPIETEVNPGNVVAVHMQFVDPFGKRFRPALEMDQSFDTLEEAIEDGGVDVLVDEDGEVVE